ncbi:MAG: hypothetical protein J7604_10465 [Sporocytophaga sp.]|uniref:hypothetical protein n=1 Tax=Sporocytophaga sp. TaxID=2231183 RepID=UPI001B22875C|nr:hypothetical protein [Sporocytophaga sp.]MBO9700621.1 hypothetical protein [Sporocytophaga sp.]
MIKESRSKIALSDALLLIKKIGVTVLIYLAPIIIIVGGLLLTARIFQIEQEEPVNKTESSINLNQ